MSCTWFYCLSDLRGGECDVISLYLMCCTVNGSVFPVCCVFDSVCEVLRVECAFTSPVRTEYVMFVMYCMQCCMSVSAVF